MTLRIYITYLYNFRKTNNMAQSARRATLRGRIVRKSSTPKKVQVIETFAEVKCPRFGHNGSSPNQHSAYSTHDSEGFPYTIRKCVGRKVIIHR